MFLPVDATMSEAIWLEQMPQPDRPSLVSFCVSHDRTDEYRGLIHVADYLVCARGIFFREVVTVKKVSARISLFPIGRNDRQSITRPDPGLYVANSDIRQGGVLCADRRSVRNL